MRIPLIAGNWKMHKTTADARALVKTLKSSLKDVVNREVVVCPPFTALPACAEEARGSVIGLGAQDMHWEKQGAFTGEVSPVMLVDLKCRYVIIGHSERRQCFAETDETVNKKVKAAFVHGLTPIACVGETLAEREKNITFDIIRRQVEHGLSSLAPSEAERLVIAYEPVWAIGTGKTATPSQAQEVHAFIRKLYSERYGAPAGRVVRILYGGSIKPDNMGALMKEPDVDGGLVGGASLDAESFTRIVFYDRSPSPSPLPQRGEEDTNFLSPGGRGPAQEQPPIDLGRPRKGWTG